MADTNLNNSPGLLRTIFDDCLNDDREEWSRIIDTKTAGNESLKKQVWDLLKAYESSTKTFVGNIVKASAEDFYAPTSKPRTNFAGGRKFLDFVIIRKLGEGSCGEVYEASQHSLGRNVALKIISEESHEPRTMAMLPHPNIVQVFSATLDTEIDRFVICMQYIAGVNLDTLLNHLAAKTDWTGQDILDFIDTSLGAASTFASPNHQLRTNFSRITRNEFLCNVMTSISLALDFAHSRKVLHLDLKPSNIMIDLNGQIYLTDFNISQIKGNLRTSGIGGTYRYMSPEHEKIFTDREAIYAIDHRADIYSLGVILQDVLNCLNILPKELVGILNRCLSSNPSFRPNSAEEIARACRNFLTMQNLKDRLKRSQNWFLYNLGNKSPVLAFSFAALVPNMIAGAIQVYYNQIHILPQMSQAQVDLFTSLLLPWNAFVFTMGFFGVYYFYRPLVRSLKNAKTTETPNIVNPEQFDAETNQNSVVRQTLIKNGFLGAALILLGWSSGCVLFISSLHWVAGPLSPNLIYHFIVSFFLGMSIPLAYCFLMLSYLNFVVFYPNYAYEIIDQKLKLSQETRRSRQLVALMRFFAGALPLLGAIVAVHEGPGAIASPSSRLFETLIISLIVTGIFGFVLSVTLADRFEKAMVAIFSET